MTQIPVKSPLIVALEQMEREKGVKKEEILKMVEGAVVSALRKYIGKTAQIEAIIDPETAEIKAWQVKKVVEVVANPELEMSILEAKAVNPKAELNEELRFNIQTEDFSRIAAQTAKQVLIQRMREVERNNVYEEFKPREGEMLNGSVHRFMEGNLIVDLGKTEAILPLREQIRKERYNVGDRIRAIIIKVDKSQRGPQIVLSRAAPEFLKRLLEVEIPEVSEKTVEILDIVRDPGFRAKVAVRSNNIKVDPVGACVGIKGSRIRSITNELSGERIDLIAYNPDAQQYVASAMAPARVSVVRVVDKENKRAEIIVPDDQLAIAIGREGQNIRLASKLTGWQIDVRSEGQRAEQEKKVQATLSEDLKRLEGVGPKTAEILIKAGMADIVRLSQAKADELCTLQGVGEKTAQKIIQSAKKYLKEKAKEKPDEDSKSKKEKE